MIVSRRTSTSAIRPTELSDVHDVILVLEDSGLVVVDIKIIGCAEDGHDTREAGRPSLPIHSVAGILSLVGADDGEKIVLFEESACSRIREEVRAAADVVVDEKIISFLLSKLLEWISPENVAHEAMCRWFAESINLFPVSEASAMRLEPRTPFRSSKVWSSGLNPPCMHRNCLFMTAARGRAQNESMQAS